MLHDFYNLSARIFPEIKEVNSVVTFLLYLNAKRKTIHGTFREEAQNEEEIQNGHYGGKLVEQFSSKQAPVGHLLFLVESTD